MSRSNIFASALTLVGLSIGLWGVFPSVSQAAPDSLSEDASAQTEQPSKEIQLAQFYPPSTTVVSDQRSITVTGQGQASVPADQAILQMFYYLYAAPVYEYDPSQPPPPPPTAQASDFQFAVDALTAIGVPASDIDVFADPAYYGGIRLRINIAQPTTERMREIVSTINDAVAEDARFSPSGANAIYTLNECSGVENEARRSAMTDAQQRATALAEIAGVGVGDVLSLSDYSTWGYTYSAICPSAESVTTLINQYGGYPFDPTFPPEVSVTTQITATYAIED
ncbi:MAG: SIMPL domain-containing protein [Cyanobacteria bacterium CRU_2_1]|nr:SIMPL domain-containing protein [Cyanobacteria bacterium RU_5_0]NJR58127.1 SIMPL domain-containing protein [Cyanobacteria bacterium CRU_2_1]